MPLAEPAMGPLPLATRSNGCFETMRAYGGRIFRLDDHLDRLDASATFLGTRAPSDRRRFAAQLTGALKRSGLREAVVRVALIPREAAEARPHLVVQPAQRPSAAQYRRGIHIAVVPAKKFSVASITPQAKYSARLGSVRAISEAHVRGVDEAVFLDETGSVTESTASNLGMVKRRVIQTPPCWLGLLPGITRDMLAELAASSGVHYEEVPLTRHDLYNADEVFLTSTLKEVLAVTRVDGRVIGSGRPGPVTRQLLHAFRGVVRRELRLGQS